MAAGAFDADTVGSLQIVQTGDGAVLKVLGGDLGSAATPLGCLLEGRAFGIIWKIKVQIMS